MSKKIIKLWQKEITLLPSYPHFVPVDVPMLNYESLPQTVSVFRLSEFSLLSKNNLSEIEEDEDQKFVAFHKRKASQVSYRNIFACLSDNKEIFLASAHVK